MSNIERQSIVKRSDLSDWSNGKFVKDERETSKDRACVG